MNDVWGLIQQLLMFALTILAGLIAYLLKSMIQGFKEDQARQDKAIGELRSDLTNLKDDLPFRYVTREDWLRQEAAVTTKLDRIEQHVLRLMPPAQLPARGGE